MAAAPSLSRTLRPLATPLRWASHVVHGFGRGGKELGCPTANMETGALEPELSTVENGVYAGWCSVEGYPEVFKTVLSVGWNPHFEGTKKTVEPHVLHTFAEDFYGCEMRLLIVGYIRPQEKYSSLDELIAAIDADIECGRTSLDEPAHAALQSDPSLTFAASAST